LVAGLTLVAEKAGGLSASPTLVAGLALVAKLARRLIGESRAGHAQSQGGTEHNHRNLAFHESAPSRVFETQRTSPRYPTSLHAGPQWPGALALPNVRLPAIECPTTRLPTLSIAIDVF
jgi:hypothetical protein